MLTRRKSWGWAISEPPRTAVLDACVLFPAPLRDILIELAAARAFRARWTDAIHEEWITNLLRARPDLEAVRLARTRELMNRAVPDCLVTGYSHLIEEIAQLPDDDDRHVLAAAIAAKANSIVTFNLADFPTQELSRHGLEALHPDVFLSRLIGENEAIFLAAACRCRTRLRRPATAAPAYLAILERQGLQRTVQRLRPLSASI